MLVSRRRPPAPPPPPPRRPSRRLSRDPSLASLTSEDFVVRGRYRCCCRRLHLRTASLVIAVLDMTSMLAAFVRGVQVGRNVQHNPMAISWFVASSLIFVLGVFGTLSMVYGVFRERYLWMLPVLVLKAFLVLVCVASAVMFVYMMAGHNEYLLALVVEHVTKFDYEAARMALRFGGGALVLCFSLMALVELWFLRVLYRCYGYLKDKYFWLVCHRANRIRTVAVEYIPSPDDEAGAGNGIRHSNRPLVNGHGNGGPSNSVSNSTALTEVEPLALSFVAPPTSLTGPVLTQGGDSLVTDSCYTPIVNDGGSDRERLWKAFEHTHV